ncbi:hypothetical protein [Candidatus Frankia alpina]|uniref:Uncharacterized protein n=1 Tax=Candidatus Frankia alpina TaxID=2699483 RepID=A0A4S5C530_9ACTN|nr:hypothetical protein [Candidatus Frankia alpina]THJ37606.1 hypothetical protein E7Y31_21135 [Candidatus Frankia alpina]
MPLTQLTRNLVELVDVGLPGRPAQLTLDGIFPDLRDRLALQRLPTPTRMNVQDGGAFVFARNAAPPDTHHDLELEIARLRRQVADAQARERTLRQTAQAQTEQLERLRHLADEAHQPQENLHDVAVRDAAATLASTAAEQAQAHAEREDALQALDIAAQTKLDDPPHRSLPAALETGTTLVETTTAQAATPGGHQRAVSAISLVPAPPESATKITVPAVDTGLRIRRRLGAVAAMFAGGLTMLLGVLIASMSNSEAKAGLLGFQMLVYGVFRLVQIFVADELRARRRGPFLAILAAGSLAAGVVVLSYAQDDFYNVPRAAFALFWIIGGPAEVVSALRAGSHPGRRLEILFGVLGTVAGWLIGIATTDTQIFLRKIQVVSLETWLILLGVIIAVIGFKLHNAVARPRPGDPGPPTPAL